MQRMTTSDGLSLAYTRDDYHDPWQPREPLLLLHAAMGSSSRWYAMVPALARQYPVIRPDMRGHGASDVPSPALPFSLDRLVADVVELLDHLGLERVHVLGNSAGGYIAQRLAIEHPSRVKSLVLYCSTPGLKHSHASTWLPQIAQKGLRAFLAETIDERFEMARVEPAFVEWFLDKAANNDDAFIQKFVGTMAGIYFMDDVKRIQCPTLIVAPGAEPIGHASSYGEMQQQISGSELISYEHARHNICDYLPDRCAADALAFLARVER